MLDMDHFVELLARYDSVAAERVRGELASVDQPDSLRALRTALGELLDRRQSRCRHAEQRRAATERALRQRRAELTAHRLDLVADWPRRVRADLARARLNLAGQAAEALRGLRDEARARLERADRAGRQEFPARLASATARLTAELTARLDAAFDEIERDVEQTWPPQPPQPPQPSRPEAREVQPRPPALALRKPPALPGGWVEGWFGLLVGASGGLALGRLALTWLDGVSGALGAGTVPAAVGIGVGAAFCLVVGRRAAVDRMRLTRWASESLADLRVRLESMLAERVLVAERRLAGRIDRVVAARVTDLDTALREHELLTRRLELDAAPLGAEPSVLAELRAACAELDQRQGGDSGASGPAVAR
jgi:hypothetical protein